MLSSVSYMVNRFVLEPKAVLLGEQEQKLKDSEAAIASLQVRSFHSWIYPWTSLVELQKTLGKA